MGHDNLKGIKVESELGKGSIFSFILENKRIIQKEISEVDEDISKVSVKLKDFPIQTMKQVKKIKIECCPRILVVDDEGFNIQALGCLLDHFGYTYDFTFHGEFAIAMIRDKKTKPCQCHYSLILMDCNMPVMNGYEACQQIHQMIRDKEIPALKIVAVTADVTRMNL